MATRISAHSPELDKLIEKQLRNWEIARQQRIAGQGAERTDVAEFVTISRPMGAGGQEIARRLGDRLGWPVFDRELLIAMAGDDGVRARLYETMDERDEGWLDAAMRWVIRGEVQDDDYFHRLTRTVLALARQGPAVFLGRGADLILPPNRGLRVRIEASPLRCAQEYAAREKITFERAERELRRVGRERARFLRHHFGERAADPYRHDLTINLDRVALDEAVELIVWLMKHRGAVR